MTIAQIEERKRDRLMALLRAHTEVPQLRSYEHFSLKPLGRTIGAEVSVDLASNLHTPGLREELRDAMNSWKALFFRDQSMSLDDFLKFGALWGEIYAHPFTPPGDSPLTSDFEKGPAIRGQENAWHSDDAWMVIPSAFTILRAKKLPALGGDTLFVDMSAAYDDLPGELKQRLDGCMAENRHSIFWNGWTYDLQRHENDEERRAKYPPVMHPLIRTHPETGRKSIYADMIHTTRIRGLAEDESEQLLVNLVKRASTPEYQCRFTWTPDAIAIWDNRVAQHYASSDYWPQERRMERMIIRGDTPI